MWLHFELFLLSGLLIGIHIYQIVLVSLCVKEKHRFDFIRMLLVLVCWIAKTSLYMLVI